MTRKTLQLRQFILPPHVHLLRDSSWYFLFVWFNVLVDHANHTDYCTVSKRIYFGEEHEGQLLITPKSAPFNASNGYITCWGQIDIKMLTVIDSMSWKWKIEGELKVMPIQSSSISFV